MSPASRSITFRVEPELWEAMTRLKNEHGTPYSVQVRRGLVLYLESRGVIENRDRKRPGRRKRP